MVPYLLLVNVVAALLLWHAVVYCEEEEDSDNVKGPLIKPKDGGGLWTTAQIIEQIGYKPETHVVVTKKGYKITVFRVLSKKQPPLGVVVMQHDYLMSSDAFVSDKDALAFKLADAGYCVWILNSRGNVYGRNHTTLLPNQKEFWDFSLHEVATEDLPSIIEFVISKTGFPKVHYIGHSLGAMIGFILTSQLPEFNDKFESMVALEPAMYLSKMSEMIGEDGMVEEMASNFVEAFKKSNKSEVFPRADVPKDPQNQITCDNVGENFKEMCVGKMTEAQAVLGGPYLPAGTSLKILTHIYNSGRAGEMRWYKYDTPEENKKAYGKEEPPSYVKSFNKITVPIFLGYSDMDQMIMPEDIEKLKPRLKSLKKEKHITAECFDHVTFLFARQKSCMSFRAELYQEIIDFFLSYNKKSK